MVDDIPKDEVVTQLNKILNFKDISKSLKLKSFLTFIIDLKLKNEISQISAYNIAVNVFQRDQSFDSAIDPIVRVQAGKLRRLLKLYYSTIGKDDRIIIKIPRGAYEPFFRLKNQIAQNIQTNPYSDIESNPTIAVLPFKLLSKDEDYEHLAHGIAEELSLGLSNFSEINVIAYFSMVHINYHNQNIQEVIDKYKIGYLITGSITVRNEIISLRIYLGDTKTGKQLWANQLSFGKTEFEIETFTKKVCEKSLSIIGGSYGIISRERWNSISKNKIENFNAYEAIFRYRQLMITGDMDI